MWVIFRNPLCCDIFDLTSLSALALLYAGVTGIANNIISEGRGQRKEKKSEAMGILGVAGLTQLCSRFSHDRKEKRLNFGRKKNLDSDGIFHYPCEGHANSATMTLG